MNIPNLPDHELYTRVQLDAARKNLSDCRERESEAFKAYMDASAATTNAYARERDAFYAWFITSRPAGRK
jgi:hypothetical protein